VSVHSAGIQDRDGAAEVLARACRKYPTLQTVFVDRGYEGPWRVRWEQQHACRVQVCRPLQPEQQWHRDDWAPMEPLPRFAVQPKRWVIERSNAWTQRPRRMAKDYDLRVDVSEAWIWFVHAILLLHRLAAIL
jgi:transposase